MTRASARDRCELALVMITVIVGEVGRIAIVNHRATSGIISLVAAGPVGG